MGAKFESIIFTKRLVNINSIIKEIRGKDSLFKISEIEVFDNWDFEGLNTFDISSNPEKLDEQILNKKIVLIRLVINNKECGFYSERIGKERFVLKLWRDIVADSSLDSNTISNYDRHFYDEIVQMIITLSKGNRLFIAGIGIEMSIEYSRDIRKTVNESSGVNMWIIPCGMKTLINQQLCNCEILYIGESNM